MKPYRAWTHQETKRAESPHTAAARRRYLNDVAWLGLESKPELVKTDNPNLRVEPEEKEE